MSPFASSDRQPATICPRSAVSCTLRAVELANDTSASCLEANRCRCAQSLAARRLFERIACHAHRCIDQEYGGGAAAARPREPEQRLTEQTANRTADRGRDATPQRLAGTGDEIRNNRPCRIHGDINQKNRWLVPCGKAWRPDCGPSPYSLALNPLPK